MFFLNDTATTEIYTYRHTLSLHDALPISITGSAEPIGAAERQARIARAQRLMRESGLSALLIEPRSEEHTSELQSLMRISYAVFCLEKKKQLHESKIETLHQI